MKLTRTKARSRLASKLPKGSPSIRFMRQVGDGLLAFRQGAKALLTTSDDELPTIIGECAADHLGDIPPAMAAQGSNNPQADINSDGKVTAADATPIIDHVIGNKKL